MLRVVGTPCGLRSVRCQPLRRRLCTTAVAAKQSDPLRILFCGSDDFSCESLKALHREHVDNRGLVERLDVMVRPGKMTARGNKVLREVPCKGVAQNLGLRIHERDTFRGWDLPEGTNLIVAVSFGLFVPPRILRAAEYGGLNVHPSSLPHLRGPAPIHHAILRGDEHIGVSLQTLDENVFDHGTILSQTPAPGLPIPPRITVQELTRTLAAEGARMLVQGLRDGVHVPPREQVAPARGPQDGDEQPIHAPKVTKADSQIRWRAWTPGDFERRMRVLGAVWTLAAEDAAAGADGPGTRVIFTDAEVVRRDDGPPLAGRRVVSLAAGGEDGGVFVAAAELDDRSGECMLELREGLWLRVRKAKVSGKPERPAASAMRPFTRLKDS